MRIQLFRIAQSPVATYGVLLYEGIPFTLTLERPWLFNMKNVSCIPVGTYRAARVQSPKHGNTFQVQGVPGRDGINFHKGNHEDDTEGCILVGEQFEIVEGKPGIAASSLGFPQFLELLKDVNEFVLEITDRR